MYTLPLRVTFLTFLLMLSFSANSKSICLGSGVGCFNNYHVDKSASLYRLAVLPGLLANNVIERLDLNLDLTVPGLFGDQLFGTGDIYIDSDYFYQNMMNGLVFDQQGSVYFGDARPLDFVMPDFADWDFSEGIGFTNNHLMVDYLITADTSHIIQHFHTMGNIYVMDIAGSMEVPLPAAGWLFASALTAVMWLRKRPV
ncbi:hypothetical protein [Oceanicoccus sp. KOV_DT_Chl]|uniref:hypothetical protein n=1 Tax=Oceanicoccus sp. KOV_DT_Chl TaxID=1904639 RepID=UPI000C7A8398|nr:hypothetical protein [Oceanicoccus sp. KOV_DT_Chl]